MSCLDSTFYLAVRNVGRQIVSRFVAGVRTFQRPGITYLRCAMLPDCTVYGRQNDIPSLSKNPKLGQPSNSQTHSLLLVHSSVDLGQNKHGLFGIKWFSKNFSYDISIASLKSTILNDCTRSSSISRAMWAAICKLYSEATEHVLHESIFVNRTL